MILTKCCYGNTAPGSLQRASERFQCWEKSLIRNLNIHSFMSEVILQKNLSALRKSYPEFFRRAEQYQHICADPHPHPVPQERIAESVRKIQLSIQQKMDFLYLLGISDGSVLSQTAPLIVKQNRGILVIEPEMEHFFTALRVTDLTGCLRNPRIFWAVGDHLHEQIIHILDHTLCYAAEHACFHTGDHEINPAYSQQLLRILEFIRQKTSLRRQQLIERVKKLPDRLRKQKIPGRMYRVWSFQDVRNKARYSLIQHVLIRTLFYYLRKSGFVTEYTVLHPNQYYPPYYRIYKMALFEPDLIFLCNEGPAYEGALGEELSRSLPIPKVIWFADDPVHGEHLLQRHRVTSDETCLVADYEWDEPLLENGAQEILYMPGAATRIRRGRKRSSRTCDIVFVGQVRDQSAFFHQLSPAWRQYAERIVSEKLRFPRLKIRDVMANFPPPTQLAQDYLDEFRQRILWEANTRFRVQAILRLTKHNLLIYGNSDWLTFLPPELAQRCFRGVLRFKHLFEVYRNSRIVLNIHSLQSYTCLNVRDFDVPAAGGFLLSDWLPRAEEVFVPGFIQNLPLTEHSREEIFFYRSLTEMQQLVEYFLTHPDARLDCIERARHKVLHSHTYQHRAEWLAELFRERIENFH